ncbi:MAG: site-2 protease family protein [Planctomycetota bacterium]|nr:site-2 protease family protein [Planctomycetota bacterium]
MLLGEPARTPYDLHFRLLGFAIRIHPAFWIVALLMGFYGSNNDPVTVLTFVLAVLISIVVHELGHALMFRRYRIQSHVVLYHFGGLAIPDSMDSMAGYGRSSRYQQLMVSVAGPLAQLLLALLVILALRLGGYTDGVVSRYLPLHYTADPIKGDEFFLQQARVEDAEMNGKIVLDRIQGLSARDQHALASCDINGDGEVDTSELSQVHMSYVLPSRAFRNFIIFLVYISIFWALLNLMPVYPLDGGQIARELFQLSGTSAAIEKSLMVSIGTGVIIGLLGFRSGQAMIAFMFLILAWSSFQTLQQYRGMGGGYR